MWKALKKKKEEIQALKKLLYKFKVQNSLPLANADFDRFPNELHYDKLRTNQGHK